MEGAQPSAHTLQPEVATAADSHAPRVLSACRIHFRSASLAPDIEIVASFVSHARVYAQSVLIVISIGNDLEHISVVQNIREAVEDKTGLVPVIVLSLTPWGKFTPALNAAVAYAIEHDYPLILFQSLETRISEASFHRLLQHMTHDTLVVGTALTGHEFHEGCHPIRGMTCPWNTCALWDTSKLGLTGFPLIGDGRESAGVEGGVEEVTAVSLLQHFRRDCRAKLLVDPDVQWRTEWSHDPVRQAKHSEKMRSKDERPKKQMQILGVDAGLVEHIAC